MQEKYLFSESLGLSRFILGEDPESKLSWWSSKALVSKLALPTFEKQRITQIIFYHFDGK